MSSTSFKAHEFPLVIVAFLHMVHVVHDDSVLYAIIVNVVYMCYTHPDYRTLYSW